MADRRALSDEQYRRYLTDGYIEVRPSTFAPADHESLYRRASELYDEARAATGQTAHLDILGDNLRARVPQLDDLLNDPIVDGALAGLLGDEYLIHPHSYCHRSSGTDQIFHQDGNLPWNERGHVRSHRPDWLMLFYYPQDVDETNGPTEVVAGSQYWTIDHETEDDGWHPGDRVDRSVDASLFESDDLDARDSAQTEALRRGLGFDGLDRRFLHLEAGTVLLAHYDLFHRGSRTEGHPRPRYMYKFYFARTAEPTGRLRPSSGPSPGHLPSPAKANWEWLTGHDADHPDTAAAEAQVDVDRRTSQLLEGPENRRVEAAYGLGRMARSGHVGALVCLEQALVADAEAVRRNAAVGLRQAAEAGLSGLTAGLGSDAAPVRRAAVAGLGTTVAAGRPEVVAAVARLASADDDDLVRSNALYSLGQMSRVGDGFDTASVIDVVLGRLDPVAEPDNAFGAGLARSTVRQSAAFALVQLLANQRPTDAQIDRVIDGPLRDGDRYIQGLTAEGLARCDLSPAASRRVVGYLSGRRWNPTPP